MTRYKQKIVNTINTADLKSEFKKVDLFNSTGQFFVWNLGVSRFKLLSAAN